MKNPALPHEINDFTETDVVEQERHSLSQYEKLHAIELRDIDQQLKMRPLVAIFFGFLLLAQNYIVFALVWWALKNEQLAQLQWIFAALIGGSLVETYKVSQLIVNRLFEPIDYKDKHERFKY